MQFESTAPPSKVNSVYKPEPESRQSTVMKIYNETVD